MVDGNDEGLHVIRLTVTMSITLLLLRCDRTTAEWVREGHKTFDDEDVGTDESKARAYGEAWVSGGSDERREYRILRARALLTGSADERSSERPLSKVDCPPTRPGGLRWVDVAGFTSVAEYF